MKTGHITGLCLCPLSLFFTFPSKQDHRDHMFSSGSPANVGRGNNSSLWCSWWEVCMVLPDKSEKSRGSFLTSAKNATGMFGEDFFFCSFWSKKISSRKNMLIVPGRKWGNPSPTTPVFKDFIYRTKKSHLDMMRWEKKSAVSHHLYHYKKKEIDPTFFSTKPLLFIKKQWINQQHTVPSNQSACLAVLVLGFRAVMCKNQPCWWISPQYNRDTHTE